VAEKVELKIELGRTFIVSQHGGPKRGQSKGSRSCSIAAVGLVGVGAKQVACRTETRQECGTKSDKETTNTGLGRWTGKKGGGQTKNRGGTTRHRSGRMSRDAMDIGSLVPVFGARSVQVSRDHPEK